MDFTATRYEYKGFVIDLRSPKNNLWGIIDGGLRLNRKTKEWDYEPMPSSRSDKWIEDHCFTLDEARKFIDGLGGEGHGIFGRTAEV